MPQPSSITLSNLSYITPQRLSTLLLTSNPTSTTPNPNSTSSTSNTSPPNPSPNIAIIDVRDSDHVGGHIAGSIHAPITQLDARMPELLRTLADKDTVVFHCMLSQERGPRAALAYARAKARVGKGGEENGEDGKEGKEGRIGGQQICVLEGGFGTWQSRYGKDPRLTEGYVKELWEGVWN